MGKGGVGNVWCSMGMSRARNSASRAGKIATYKYDVIDEKNMVGSTEIKQLDDRCLEATTTGHAKEASRTPNGWLCKPAERTIQIYVSYCQ